MFLESRRCPCVCWSVGGRGADPSINLRPRVGGKVYDWGSACLPERASASTLAGTVRNRKAESCENTKSDQFLRRNPCSSRSRLSVSSLCSPGRLSIGKHAVHVQYTAACSGQLMACSSWPHEHFSTLSAVTLFCFVVVGMFCHLRSHAERRLSCLLGEPLTLRSAPLGRPSKATDSSSPSRAVGGPWIRTPIRRLDVIVAQRGSSMVRMGN